MQTLESSFNGCLLACRSRLPPFLILHGTHDKTVPFQIAVEFWEALKVRGWHLQLCRLGCHLPWLSAGHCGVCSFLLAQPSRQQHAL